MVVEARAATRPGLGRAVALEHGHAEVLPALLERRREEGARGQEEPEVTSELPMDAAEQARPDGHREVTRDRPEPGERRIALTLADFALDRAPEEVEDLRDDHHRCDPVVAKGIEDDARIAAPHVQDVGADR